MITEEKADQYLKVEAEMQINASPEKVFEAITVGQNQWWPFRTRPDATVVYEPKPGGFIYEDWGNGKFTAYGQVMEYDPEKRSSIAIGPGGIGNVAFSVRSIDEVIPDGKGGSIYKRTRLFWGLIPDESAEMYKSGVSQLGKFLKDYLETGKVYSPKK